MSEDHDHDHDPGVNYSTKELFEKIDVKLDSVVKMLDGKADEVDVIALRAQLQDVSEDVEILKDRAVNSKWTIGQVVLPSLAIIVSISVAIWSSLR